MQLTFFVYRPIYAVEKKPEGKRFIDKLLLCKYIFAKTRGTFSMASDHGESAISSIIYLIFFDRTTIST